MVIVVGAIADANANANADAAGASTVIALPATLTMNDAGATRTALAAQLAVAELPVIDAAGLQVLDTAALAVLLDCRRQTLALGRTLHITGVPPKLLQLAQLYGVDALLGA